MPHTNTMKTILAALGLGLSLALAAGCAGTNPRAAAPPEQETITDEDIEQTPRRTLQDLLVERVPGVQVTQTPEGTIQVRMRGYASFSGSDRPLFVVDGFPVDPNPDGSLPGVLVTEIESIKVLKDPVDTAQYGMRGTHGVIVVTTKKGRG